MPELPEVETIARGVDQKLRDARIVSVQFASYPRLCKIPAAVQAEGLRRRGILSVHRTGKHIVFELGVQGKAARAESPQAQWIVHLGMTGRLLVGAPDERLAAHTHVRMSLNNGLELRYVDPRRFGRLEFRDLTKDLPFTAAGAEPLTIGEQEFAALFAGRKVAIKTALLNQRLLTGVGNIYADESLFEASIRPSRPAGSLRSEELEALRRALRRVLRASIRLGGSSISDYVNASGEGGLFQLRHRVYGRTGRPCPRCGRAIERQVIGGRSSHACGGCQN